VCLGWAVAVDHVDRVEAGWQAGPARLQACADPEQCAHRRAGNGRRSRRGRRCCGVFAGRTGKVIGVDWDLVSMPPCGVWMCGPLGVHGVWWVHVGHVLWGDGVVWRAGVDMLMVWCCHCSDTPSRALIRLQAEQRCGLGPGQQRQDGGGTAWADALWGWMEAETSLSCAAGLEAMEHTRPQDRPGQPACELVSQRAVRARVVCACGTWLRPDGD